MQAFFKVWPEIRIKIWLCVVFPTVSQSNRLSTTIAMPRCAEIESPPYSVEFMIGKVWAGIRVSDESFLDAKDRKFFPFDEEANIRDFLSESAYVDGTNPYSI